MYDTRNDNFYQNLEITDMDAIFAQCSAQGKAGITVFRISGSKTINVLKQIVCNSNNKFEPRKMYFRKIYDPKSKEQIDESMVVFFKGKKSFTGEDSAEIYVHGSLAVIKMLNKALMSIPYIRLAEPGEFTKRAFLNGKMDLTAAEGLADLIDSETELQQKQAIRQLGGGLKKIYDKWRKQLLDLISLLEAYIDFPEEDISEEILRQVEIQVQKLIKEIKLYLEDNNRGERLRSGLKLVILGKPNVGKSSLLNFLMKRDVAIVSNIAGTTRDVIEGHIDIAGYPIILQDTAGIHNKIIDPIEKEGIDKAIKIAKDADIRIVMHDVASQDQDIDSLKGIIDNDTIIVLNKIDLCKTPLSIKLNQKNIVKTSVKNQIGLDQLLNKITIIAEKIAKPNANQSPQITRARHRVQLENALEYLSNFSVNNDLVLSTEDIRIAMRSISNITGKITIDEILGEIFSNFCIGK